MLISLIPRRSVTTRANEGGESLVTTELLGVHALIVFIMVMTTFYAYVLIIHTVTSHEHCVQDGCCFVFFTYESTAECAACRTETAFGNRYSSLIPLGAIQKPLSKRTKKYSLLLFFLQNKLDFLSLDKACK